MQFSRILLIMAALLSTPGVAAKNGAVPDFLKNGLPNIKSAAALVVDLGSDSILFEKGADEVRPIASISKMIGAMVIVEECNLPPDETHEMSVSNREAAKGGDKSKLTTGWSYSNSDLMHAALMRSDNRALPALGEACGMTPAVFGEKMTAKAKKLGLTKTAFKEPNGLSPENVSTPRELMVVLRHILKVPSLTSIMGKTEYHLTAEKSGRRRTIKIKNTDRLLNKNLAEILAGKTGYTDLARYCLAIAAKTMEGRDVGMVFLGAEGRYTRFADFTRVIRWLGPDNPFLKAGTPVRVSTSSEPTRAQPATIKAEARRVPPVTIPYNPLVGPPLQAAPANLAPDASASPETNKW
jgi:D-alanyl-D-alanine endopeptidase (penicillin-binding protein 7)